MVRRQRRRSTRWERVIFAVIFVSQCLFYRVLSSRKIPHQTGTISGASAGQAEVRPAAIRTPSRPIYPYSVIRGGVYSADELNRAARTDAAVAAHYVGFDRARIRVAPAPEATRVHVSYRKGDRVLWTRRKVRLGAQEPLLTDGTHLVRARCGNRISVTPQEPTSADEPPEVTMDLPEPPAADVPEIFGVPPLVHEIFPPPSGKGPPEAGAGPGEYAGATAFAGGGPWGLPGTRGAGERAPLTQGQEPDPGPENATPPFQFAESRVEYPPAPPPTVAYSYGSLEWWIPPTAPPGKGLGSPKGTTPASEPAVAPSTPAEGVPPGGVGGLPPVDGSPDGAMSGELTMPPRSGPELPAGGQFYRPIADLPEPGTVTLLLCGVAALAARRMAKK